MLSTIRSACLAAGLSILALVAFSPAAEAGTYQQYTCKLPDGTPAGTDGWTPDAVSPFLPQSDDYDQSAGLRTQMQGVGISSGVERAWTWAPAANTTLQEAHLYRAFSLTTGDSTATPFVRATAGPVVIEHEGSSPATGTGVSSRGSYASWSLPANHLEVLDAPSVAADDVRVALGCQGTPTGTCPATGGLSDLRIQAATFTLRDASAPSITNVTGSLTTAGAKQGIQSVQFDATDTGAGIYRTFLDVDGTTVAATTPDTNAGHCADAVPANADPYEFQHRVPCPLSLAAVRIPLDTRSLA